MKQIRRKEMKSYMDREESEIKYMIDDEGNELNLGVDVGYKMKNREIEPYYKYQSTFDPSINKNESRWKYHMDNKKYNYYPE